MKKRILSIILTMCLLMCIAPISVSAAEDTYKQGDIITFGSYPQSAVKDRHVIAALDGMLTDDIWVSYGYYIGMGIEYDGRMVSSDYMKYADLRLNGEKYRAVRFSQYRPRKTSSTSSETNSTQDNNGYYLNTTYFFKYEPLTWKVLDPEEGFVIAEKSIDSQAYENFSYLVATQEGDRVYNSLDCKNLANNWATCSIREWLNKDFYNTAFTAEEKARIGKTYLDNNNPFQQSLDGAGTFDKIFLISYYDAINKNYGFNPDSDLSDIERVKETTDYAKCQGADLTYTGTNRSYWWLRTPGLYGAKNFATSPNGRISSTNSGTYDVNFTDMGVVPAFKFNPKTPALAKNSKIEFGSYPQSEVTDADEIAKLETASESYLWVSYKYYSGTGDSTDGEMEPGDFMLYKDFYSDGEMFRAVTFSDWRPTTGGGLKEKLHSFQDENGYYPNKVYYFKYDPLTWRVLDPDEGYVMCENAIDSQAYQNYVIKKDGSLYNSKDCTNYVSDWETCTLRQWLNKTFYNTAFSREEKMLIGTTYLENNSTDGTWLSTDTADKIFVLSYNDVVNSAYGFDSSNEAFDEARKIKGTAYSNSQGLYCDNDGIAYWWLRSPGDSERVDLVSYYGWVSPGAGSYGTGMGVVPAFKFNPKAVDIQLNFDLDGGEWAEAYTAPTSYKSDASVMLPTASDLSKQGYTFGGWEQTSLTSKTASYKAKWSVNKYTITFDSNGGTAVDPIVADYGTAITAPSDPTRTGYTFAGWDKQIPSTMPAEDMTVTAKWDVKQYTIIFNSNGGTAVDLITADYGTAITAPSDPTRTGYIFAGWDKQIPSTMPDRNVMITAQWTLCDHSGNTNKTTCEHETVCSVCGGTIAADPHAFSQQWSYNASEHWHECHVCGIQIDNAEHTFEWVTDKEATETEKGEKHEECSVCHATRNEHTEIPATGKDNILTRIYNWILKIIIKIIKLIIDFIYSIR